MAKSSFESMKEGMFRYVAHVPDHGLRWDDELQAADGLTTSLKQNCLGPPWLVDPIVEFNTFRREKITSPFRPPGLFRRFAELPLTREAIGKFANKYGFLGSHQVFLHYPSGTGHAENNLKLGESISFWKEEIESMHFLVGLWNDVLDAEAGKGAGPLASRIIWNAPGATKIVILKPSPGKKPQNAEVIANENLLSEREAIKQWTPNKDYIKPARYYLNRKIDAQLRGHINPNISPEYAYMDLDCLLATLYLAFKWELSGKKLPVLCPQCEEFFIPIDPRQKYCSQKWGLPTVGTESWNSKIAQKTHAFLRKS